MMLFPILLVNLTHLYLTLVAIVLVTIAALRRSWVFGAIALVVLLLAWPLDGTMWTHVLLPISYHFGWLRPPQYGPLL
jgi:hypothetical protein